MRRASRSSIRHLELARQRVVSAFATHWRKILRSRKDIAKERADFFFAGSASARERLARDFYGREHAQQMASLSTTEIRETLSPWLEHALQYWLDEYDHIGDPEGDDFLAELPTAEYVSIVCPHHTGSMLIDRYPGERVFYDDLYERMLSGCSSGGVLRIYKATGERFTPSESRSARAGITRDLRDGIASAGDDDPWVFNMQSQVYWKSAGFESEDLERVVIVEVNMKTSKRFVTTSKPIHEDLVNQLLCMTTRELRALATTLYRSAIFPIRDENDKIFLAASLAAEYPSKAVSYLRTHASSQHKNNAPFFRSPDKKEQKRERHQKGGKKEKKACP